MLDLIRHVTGQAMLVLPMPVTVHTLNKNGAMAPVNHTAAHMVH